MAVTATYELLVKACHAEPRGCKTRLDGALVILDYSRTKACGAVMQDCSRPKLG